MDATVREGLPMNNRVLNFFKVGVWGFCLLITLAASAGSQEKLVNLQRIDLSDLPDIHLYLTVTDAAGQSVLGLTDQEIFITIDGRRQVLTSLVSALEGGENLAVALLFDRSGSMKKALEETKSAAVSFIKRMSEGDLIAVVSFDDLVRVDSEFTGDKSAVEAAIEGISLGRDTALFDAVQKALEMLRNVSTNRQAIVILSDGKDTKSRLNRNDVLQAARNQGVPLYTVNLAADADLASLDSLSDETGGAAFRAAAPGELLTLYQRIAEQLNNQYLITFRSTAGMDEKFHNLKITVEEPGGAAFAATRDFVASKGPGIKRERLAGMKREMVKKDVVLWSGIGAFFGLLLGMLILIILRIGRPDISLRSPLTAALFLASILLGAIFGAFYILSK